MNKSAILKRMTAFVMACVLLMSAAQAESWRAIVTRGSMKVYADAARTWQIGALPMTTVVTVRETSGGTALISAGGNTGYAAVSDLAALDSLATRVVFSVNSRVYQRPSLGSAWLNVPAGLELNLLATNGQWAMVENGGIVAYTNRAHLAEKKAEIQPEPEQPETNGSAGQIVTETFTAVITADAMRIYQAASDSSACIGSLPKGLNVTVHAYSGAWAYIELAGNYGFAHISDLSRVSAPEQDEPERNDPYSELSGESVEKIIFMFLTKEMGLNTAVACGILANVDRECSFRVTAASSDGGYGICQWTGVRNTRLKNWCEKNDYDYTTLQAQLWFLKYELENHHPKTLRYLRSVENSPAGAYDAGHYFCYHFEAPASKAKRSVERGNLAKDKYWVKYS